jgi:hypothetical protein
LAAPLVFACLRVNYYKWRLNLVQVTFATLVEILIPRWDVISCSSLARTQTS